MVGVDTSVHLRIVLLNFFFILIHFIHSLFQWFLSGTIFFFKFGLVKGHIFRGSNSAIFIFAFLLTRDQLLKERICSGRSKFFPLRVDPNLIRFSFSRKLNRKPQSLFFFVKMVENVELCQCT